MNVWTRRLCVCVCVWGGGDGGAQGRAEGGGGEIGGGGGWSINDERLRMWTDRKAMRMCVFALGWKYFSAMR